MKMRRAERASEVSLHLHRTSFEARMLAHASTSQDGEICAWHKYSPHAEARAD
jgi:hypothetical protein